MTEEMKCPKCNEELNFDEVDIGVGIQKGNYHCDVCGWRAEEECDYIVCRCLSCKSEHKTSSDTEFCDRSTTICGQCGNVGAWEFIHKKEIEDVNSNKSR